MTVVQGVASMIGYGVSGNATLADIIMDAHTRAVETALADGVAIDDSETILAYKDRFKAEAVAAFDAEMEEISKRISKGDPPPVKPDAE